MKGSMERKRRELINTMTRIWWDSEWEEGRISKEDMKRSYSTSRRIICRRT
jgi:hypothetical protein